NFDRPILSNCPGGPVRPPTALPRAFMAALLLSLSMAMPAAAGPAAAGNASTIRIDNFGRVDATYYRGAQPKGRDYADLSALGVKVLINLTSDDADASEEAMARQAGMRYVQIPMTTRQ